VHKQAAVQVSWGRAEPVPFGAEGEADACDVGQPPRGYPRVRRVVGLVEREAGCDRGNHGYQLGLPELPDEVDVGTVGHLFLI
jgi:hypothetical protein